MKTIYLCMGYSMRCIVLMCCLFLSRYALAQLDSPYTYLNSLQMPNEYFYPQALNVLDPPDGTAYSNLTSLEFRQLFLQFKQAEVQNQIPLLNELRSAVNTMSENLEAIPISVLAFQYTNIEPETYTNGLLAWENGYWYTQGNSNAQIYSEMTSFCSGLFVQSVKGNQQKFILDPACYFTNMEFPDLIEVDFDNGMGFQPLAMGQIYDVNYSNINQDKWIRIRLRIDGIWRYMGFNITVRGGDESPFTPHIPPLEWQEPGSFDSENFPWQFSTFVEDNLVQANAYTLWSDDGVLDKPFIFVEGIDFANDHTSERNGSFGWYEFSSGESESYDFLQHMPVLLNELRANNYDIILLDFKKGDHWIEYNSMLLVKLIGLVNDSKVGKESIVLSGASMGGQITRYALRYMELNDIPHCTRLWISLDSPHTGANIPLALQESLKWLAQYNASAENFVHEYLLEPAARQMLSIQAFPLDIHEAYYNEIAEMGYPEKVRKLAIANGNGNGLGLGYYPGQPLLQYDCDLDLTYPILRFHMYNLPGEAFTQSFPPFDTGYKIAELTYSEKTSGFWDFIQEGSLTQHHVEIQNTSYVNTPNLDLAPGGTRDSVKDFVEAINSGLPGQCGQINSYEVLHSFIPTTSAIGLSGIDPMVNAVDFLEENPDLCPFDRVYMATGDENQRHSELTIGQGNIVFTLDEVLNGEIQIQESLSSSNPNGNIFDYGANGDYILSDLQILSGGELYMNGTNQYEHFENIQSTLPYLEMHTSPCGTFVSIGEGGKFFVGNENGEEVADLFIEENGEIELLLGGMLRINAQSRIIIESGGVLRLSGGELSMGDHASIEIKSGGKVIVNGNTVVSPMAGISSWIVGGEIIIEGDFVDLVFQDIEGAYTKLIFTTAAEQIKGNGTNRFIVHGSSPENTMIEIQEGKWMRPFWGLREVEISNCKVDVQGQLHAVCKSDFDDVHFDGTGIIRVEASNDFDDCTFRKADVKAVFTSNLMLRMSHSNFLEGSQIQVTGGGYALRYCSFNGGENDPCLYSEHLTLSSQIYNSNFEEVNEGIVEESNIDLSIKACNFSTALIGIQKVGGRLNLRCNVFENCQWWAVVAGEYCWLNMSSHHAAGYNHFYNNETNILLEDASALDLRNGYNTLASYADMNIAGTIAGRYCQTGSSTTVWLDATRNAWTEGTIPVQPAAQGIDIETSNHCEVMLNTSNPMVTATCGQYDNGIIVPVKSISKQKESLEEVVVLKTEDAGNPLIFSSYFNGVPLQEALSEAATYCTHWNAAGNDHVAVDLFHQILTNNLDRSQTDVRWRMKWGQRYMKISLETLFSSGEELSEYSGSSFSTDVQRYVDVLNEMTDTLITDSTYTDQFYLEIDKAQLFRLIGKQHIALELLDKTDDCSLDSLEQAHLNFWLNCVSTEIELLNDMQDLIQDELDYLGDSTLNELPISYLFDQFYFGAHIYSPQDISFALCDGQAWKVGAAGMDELTISPNPAHRLARVSGAAARDVLRWEIFDSMGRILRSGTMKEGNVLRLDELSAGMVWVRLYTADAVFDRMLCIQ